MTTTVQTIPTAGAQVPALTHSEAGNLARVELDRFLVLVKSLSADDWDRPTDCTLWNVRQVLAHQAGAYAGFASWGEFIGQWSQLLRRRQPGQMPVDVVNDRQVADRAGASPAELIAELETVGPKAVSTRQRLPGFLRAVPMPFGPPLGVARLEYLTDLIYTRDTWSHRLDICRATGREMVLDADHDGRMMALVVRELAEKLERQFEGLSVVLELTGPAGGSWHLGPAGEPAATVQMDALEFSRLTSDRLKPDQVRAMSLAQIEGDVATAERVLENSSVPY
jgi:uncharacterized protein (TIGR03083 family)